MMQYTDRHFRMLARIMSVNARLYTEMVVADALLYGDADRFLRHSSAEQPVALQLGGSDPESLARAAKLGEAEGYCEINLNIGCPSDRVQSGKFGACLMAEPALVAECIAAMQGAVDVPVTVKTRIGIDRSDSYDELLGFVATLDEAGCKVLIVHARKAWLDGLSPRENREIPPLRYDVVHQLKVDFPHLTIAINGGIETLEAAADVGQGVDGVMLGRAAYNNPFLLAGVDQAFFACASPALDRFTIFARYLEYAAQELAAGTYLRHLAKPLHYLFQGQPGARQWRRYLSESCNPTGAGIDTLAGAVKCVERAGAADSTPRSDAAA
jgi:tRNA-dihydrouridine synthase A